MCDYCENLPAEVKEGDLISKLSSPDFVLYGSYVNGYEVVRINFCPMCGRNLTESEKL